jgi:hypothetical protein
VLVVQSNRQRPLPVAVCPVWVLQMLRPQTAP